VVGRPRRCGGHRGRGGQGRSRGLARRHVLHSGCVSRGQRGSGSGVHRRVLDCGADVAVTMPIQRRHDRNSLRGTAEPHAIAVGVGQHELAQPLVLIHHLTDAIDTELTQMLPQRARVSDMDDTGTAGSSVLQGEVHLDTVIVQQQVSVVALGPRRSQPKRRTQPCGPGRRWAGLGWPSERRVVADCVGAAAGIVSGSGAARTIARPGGRPTTRNPHR
jgi:hypothetical protein